MQKGYKLLFFVLVLLSFACMKDNTGIPNVSVNIHIPINHAELVNLARGGGAFLNGGFAGIVVYNTGNGYVAYDRCSTVNPEKPCAVEIDETGFNLIDPCSGGKFDLATGFPSKAPAKHALKRYDAVVSSGMLHITNSFNASR